MKKYIKYLGLLFVLHLAVLTQAQHQVTVLLSPVISAGPDLIIRPGVSSVQPMVVSNDPGNYIYSWTGPNGFASTLKQPNLSAIGNYTLTATNATGCYSSDGLVVRAASLTDTLFLTGVQTLCFGSDPLDLDDFVVYKYMGTFSGQNVSNRSFYPTTAGIFTVYWTLGPKTDSMRITVLERPNVSVYMDRVFGCEGTTALISANTQTAESYSWKQLSNNTVVSTSYFFNTILNSREQFEMTAKVRIDTNSCVVKDTIAALPISANFSKFQDSVWHNGNVYPTLSSTVKFVPEFEFGKRYHWDFGDYNVNKDTSNAIAPTWWYGNMGVFEATLTLYSNCGVHTAKRKVEVNKLISVEEWAEKLQIMLYPNPVIDMLYFDFGEDIQQLNVFDITGKLIVTNQNIFQGLFSLDVSYLTKGTYIVRVQNKQGALGTAKFIKQ